MSNFSDQRTGLTQLTPAQVKQLREKQGVKVLTYSDRTPTALPEELWSSKEVMEFFRKVIAETDLALQVASDQQAETTRPRPVSLRRVKAYVRSKLGARADEFIRVYPTFWAAATDPSIEEKELERMEELIDMLQKKECGELSEEDCKLK
jgi:hypothetical protein